MAKENNGNKGFWLRVVFTVLVGMVLSGYGLLYADTKEDIANNAIKIEKLDESKADQKYIDEKFKDQEKLVQSEFRGLRELIQQISK